MIAALLRALSWKRLFLITSLLWIAGCDAVVDPRPQVLYLHTEFLPYQSDNDVDLSNRLSREVVRQALLVAARDGLGVQTCDETLAESPPDDAHVIHLMLTERCNRSGKWHVRLTTFAEGKDSAAQKTIWEKTYDCDATTSKLYADAIPKFEADSRSALIEALKSAGLHSEKRQPGDAPQNHAASKDQTETKGDKGPDAKNPEPEAKPEAEAVASLAEANQLLLRPDFVAQFGAVRAAHQAIQAGGETPEWLSVLARGYANLATLTSHHWSSTTEVFTARAWLYGQRLAALNADNSPALTSRAYAWALGGSFQNAQADLDRIEKLPAASNAAANDDATSNDEQLRKLLHAYLSGNRAEARQIGKDNKDLKPWAAYVQFELANFARYPAWMYKAIEEVGPSCPTAYKTFDEMAHHGSELAVIRTGASAAPSAFAHFLPLSLTDLPGAPAEVRSLVPTDEAKQADFLKQLNDPEPKDPFSPLPGYVAEKLRDRSRKKLEGDASWSALATLLEEEQFVQVANFMVVITNATETPLQPFIDAMHPLIKNHRFAKYIGLFAKSHRGDPNLHTEVFGDTPIHDPRMNMFPMFSRTCYLVGPDNRSTGTQLAEQANRNFTLPGIVEFINPANGGQLGIMVKAAMGYANEARVIAPGSPVGTRLLARATPSPTQEDLLAWERTAGDDAALLQLIAQQQAKQDNKVVAVRCWEKSISALPVYSSVEELANFYRQEGDLEKWEKTLTNFLSTPSLGLEHSVAQDDLALGFAHRGDWEKAKPLALEAAKTYSCRSLSVGHYIMEGLGEWELSEKLVQAESTNYPSGDGAEWYFWCCRNGRGDVKSAEQLAAQYFALEQPQPVINTYMARGTFKLLQGDLSGARAEFQQVLAMKRGFTYTCLVAQLCREQNDKQGAADVITAMEQELANPTVERTPEVLAAGTLLLDLVKNGNPTPERVAAVEDSLVKLAALPDDKLSAVGWHYFIATELAAAGNTKEAEKYWRRALVNPIRDQILGCLSGAKLAKLNGKSRPDDDPLAAKDIWPPVPAK